MSKVKVKLNKRNLIAFMKSEEMMDIIEGEAEKHGAIDTSYRGTDRVKVIYKKKEGQNAD